ncbi:hypothetical protein HBH56_199100 [Parastagonospora nodorum]|nr:hypothetical protein HBH56_199100 [Parastagonospora nodorum]QRC97740.1 hypothetical protein JI435_084970 [Parastagonospora nodorum SN15]KAH3924735.1 hypothetical protein HBH54_192070 [Parastagonospora nodorum]KAH3965999.1 hypothetical protein HBH52_202560 [Parastagonospora nodorum]KAH4002751.1 hypothetical protein HBI10_077500 [Parastagonospora nodorum]
MPAAVWMQIDRFMAISPTVIYPLTLAGLLHYILTTQAGTASTLLIICSSRDTFLRQLAQSLQKHQGGGEEDDYMRDVISPSLHNLLTARHIKLAFCASVQALLAYLTIHGQTGSAHGGQHGSRPRMVLVNPLALHASTLSFSAQGLSRSFAAATETALQLGAVLQVVECPGEGTTAEPPADGEDFEMQIEDRESHDDTNTEQDPWEQEVSILNVSARRFGSNSGESGWAGRTVKAKRIAARWFQFQKLDNEQICEAPG